MIDILHISCSIPVDDYGSFGVFHRHYRQLPADEFRVRPVSSSEYINNIPRDEFTDRISLPARRPWWPPVRAGGMAGPWLYRLRFRLLARWLDRRVDRTRVNLVVTHLWDFYSFFAAYYARTRRLPLLLFLHDNLLDWAGSPAERRHVLRWSRYALEGAGHVFAVSAELIGALPGVPSARSEVLPPLSNAEISRRRPLRPGSPGVVHAFAGKRFPGLDALLQNLAAELGRRGDRLLIVGERRAFDERLAAEHPSVVSFQPKFATSAEALQYLAENADRLIVAYPTGPESRTPPWSSLRTSFPSRLVEYAQLRMPVLVFCEAESALAAWCLRHEYPLVAHDPAPPEIARLLAQLPDERAVDRAVDFWSRVAETEFSPQMIQASFLRSLRTAAASAAGPPPVP